MTCEKIDTAFAVDDEVRVVNSKGVNYTDIIPQTYMFNPETEDLIYADELENGMVVLVESNMRGNDKSSYTENYNLEITNRWCTVTKIRVHQEGVYFIGLYVDDQKAVRFSASTDGWVVKKDTIPVHDVNVTDITSAMAKKSNIPDWCDSEERNEN